MANNSRFIESLVHDIPMYPFSSTPDGRIVAELHRGREENKAFQERALAIQEQAIERLSKVHKGAMVVPANDFHTGEATRILADVAKEMQNAYAVQEQSAQSIELLGQATSAGFNQVHDDLGGIKGPKAPMAALSDLVRMQYDGDLAEALCAYSKGILNTEAENEVRDLFAEKMAEWSLKAKDPEDSFRQKFKTEGFIMTSAFKKSLELMKYPKTMLLKPREEVMSGIALLASVGQKYDDHTLQLFVVEVLRFFEEYRRAQQKPVSEDLLIILGQNRLLKPTVQNQVLKHYPQTRDDASLTTVNYSLSDLLRNQGKAAVQRIAYLRQGAVAMTQRQMANYHLSSIVENLTKMNAGMVDLRQMVRDFSGLVGEGFEKVNETLFRGFGKIDQRLSAIQAEMVLTRTAIAAELRNINESILYVGQEIIDSIERTNELLAELIEITRSSHKNKARQCFEDGCGCLKTAETLEHIEDAHQRFCKGINAHGMTVENHYGAALSAELLGRLEDARKYYKTMISRCEKEKNGLLSQGHEGLARVEYKSGNLPEAVEQARESQNANQENYSARFALAKYLALQGLWNEIVEVLKSLFQEKPEWKLKMEIDEVFLCMPETYRHQLDPDLAKAQKKAEDLKNEPKTWGLSPSFFRRNAALKNEKSERPEERIQKSRDDFKEVIRKWEERRKKLFDTKEEDPKYRIKIDDETGKPKKR